MKTKKSFQKDTKYSEYDLDGGDCCLPGQVKDELGECVLLSVCCGSQNLPGCAEDLVCEEVVCAADSFCCNSGWDSVCVEIALELCGICTEDCGAENVLDCASECTEAGLLALRERRMKVTHADFKKAKEKVLYKKKEGVPEGLYM